MLLRSHSILALPPHTRYVNCTYERSNKTSKASLVVILNYIFLLCFFLEKQQLVCSVFRRIRGGYSGIGGVTSLCKLSNQKTTFHCQLNNNYWTRRTLMGDLESLTTLLMCLSPSPPRGPPHFLLKVDERRARRSQKKKKSNKRKQTNWD